MTTPISPADVRKGDFLRGEHKSRAKYSVEIVSEKDGEPGVWGPSDFDWVLLDRPKPVVELPTVATLGWLHGVESEPLLDWWHLTERGTAFGSETGTGAVMSDVTAFTPAVAVPTEALGELRAGLRTTTRGHAAEACKDNEMAIRAFLAAVDSANGSPA